MSQSPDSARIIHDVSAYYTEKLNQHGVRPAGVDWKDEQSQFLRFDQLFALLRNSLRPRAMESSLLDVGCGYAAFLPYARHKGFQGRYTGLDCAAAQIDAAGNYLKQMLPEDSNYRLIHAHNPPPTADYAVASGIFNVKMHFSDKDWHDYILTQLDMMHAYTRCGFAFNCLTKHVDWRRSDLYYADPAEFFNLCQERYSKYLVLSHDYPLYEFTLIVRKDGE